MLAITGKVAEVEPCGTVIVAGTVATVGDALSAIAAPPLEAEDERETVQVDPDDGVTDVGLQERLLKTGV